VRRTRVNMIERRYEPTLFELKLEVESVMTSAYEANADISSYTGRYYEPKFKLRLDDQGYSARNSISEYLLTTGLHRKAFESFLYRGTLKDSSGSVSIVMRPDFSPKSYREELLWFYVGAGLLDQIDFSSTQANIPVLI